MAYNGTNPVSVGDKTLKSHYDRAFDNTVANNTRLDAMDLTAQRLWLLGAINSFQDQSIVTTDDFIDVFSVNSEFMLVSTQGNSFYSANKGWTIGGAVATGIAACSAVVGNSDGSMWVAAGVDATYGLAYSSDNGTSWTQVNTGGADYYHVCYSGTLYVAVGLLGAIRTSSNGTAWTARTADGTPANITFRGVAWCNTLSLFIAVGTDTTGAAHGEIQTSPDGITWTARTSATYTGQFESVSEIDFGSTTYVVAVGTNSEIQYSANGTSGWTAHTDSNLAGATLYRVIASPTGGVVVTSNGKISALLSISTSTRLVSLPSAVSSSAAGLYTAVTGLVVVGSNGGIVESIPYAITSL